MNRRTSVGPAPIDLASWTPLIESPSSMVTLRSASSRCWAEVISRRIRATRRLSQMAGGITTSEISASRHERTAIATAVATVVVRFEAIEVAVEVTTFCMPPMSLVMRDCTSPVRVRVKNAIDCRCRWAKTSVRSPCMTRWPTWVLIQVCTTPRTDVTAATATMPTVSSTSRCRSWSGSATSMTPRSRNGEARPTIDDGDDDRHDAEDGPAVRREQPRDPAQRDLAGLLLLGGAGLLGRAEAAPAGGGSGGGVHGDLLRDQENVEAIS